MFVGAESGKRGASCWRREYDVEDVRATLDNRNLSYKCLGDSGPVGFTRLTSAHGPEQERLPIHWRTESGREPSKEASDSRQAARPSQSQHVVDRRPERLAENNQSASMSALR